MGEISKRAKIKERSCGIIVVRYENGKPLFLLLGVGKYFDAPKGRMEQGETPIQTALRETEEESTIKPSELDFKWGQDCIETEAYKKGTKTATYFVAETTRKNITLPISPEIGKPEHDKWAWFDYEQAHKVLNERMRKVLDWAAKKIGAIE